MSNVRFRISTSIDGLVDSLTGRVILTGLVAAALGGCTAYGGPVVDPYSYPSIHVPKGHMPPPGECRIWFPDRPPGQQPPPGNCHELIHRVPPGAVLIHG